MGSMSSGGRRQRREYSRIKRPRGGGAEAKKLESVERASVVPSERNASFVKKTSVVTIT